MFLRLHSSRALLLPLSAAGLAVGVLFFFPDRAPVAAPVGSRAVAVGTRPAETEPVSPSESPDTKKRWGQLCAQPPTIARDAELADTLEELADADPDIAAELLLSLSEPDRRRVVAAVLIDAARQPENAVRLAGEFCRADPTVAADHGYSLVATLTRAGEFEAALRFVQIQDAIAGETENPSKWLGAVFAGWAERQPQFAARAAAALAGEGVRDEALQAVATAWVKTDPAGAADFAAQLPAGPARALALDLTLRLWVEKNPGPATEWIGRFPPAVELDHGTAAVATQPQLAAQHPGLALGWGERIVDDELRSHTVATIVRTWAASDSAAAIRHAQTSPALLVADRAALLAEFAAGPGP